MSSKRRYKVGLNPVYDREFNSRRIGSRVINGGNMLPGVNTIIWDKSACIGLLLELRGSDDGYFYRNGLPVKADIPNCHEKITKLEKDFANYQQEAVNRGYPKPAQWPAELIEERFKREAQLDVMEEERDVIQERLDKFIAEERKRETDKMLMQGPSGNRRLQNGMLVEIDGQEVEQINGRFVITQTESPYFGVSVTDYQEHISEPWAKARLAIDNEEYKLTHEMYERGIRNPKLFKEEWDLLLESLYEENPDWKTLFAIKNWGNRPPMPEVPKDLKKYL